MCYYGLIMSSLWRLRYNPRHQSHIHVSGGSMAPIPLFSLTFNDVYLKLFGLLQNKRYEILSFDPNNRNEQLSRYECQPKGMVVKMIHCLNWKNFSGITIDTGGGIDLLLPDFDSFDYIALQMMGLSSRVYLAFEDKQVTIEIHQSGHILVRHVIRVLS